MFLCSATAATIDVSREFAARHLVAEAVEIAVFATAVGLVELGNCGRLAGFQLGDRSFNLCLRLPAVPNRPAANEPPVEIVAAAELRPIGAVWARPVEITSGS